MSIPKTLGHYQVLGQIGAGGMGEVYRARDTRLDRDVALKTLPSDMAADRERRRRFEREAKAVAALNHPNIVTIFSVETADVPDEEPGGSGDGQIHFLTMELVKGQPLGSFIPPAGMTIADLLKHAVPLADAVASAHEQGIVHRDLKPQNVMVDTKGRLKVLDFGLAKVAAPPLGPDEATQTMVTGDVGRVMGTMGYMSPEQAQGKDVDPRSDVFSLGVMLYEMATGKNPFRGDSPASTIASIIKDEPAPVHEVRSKLPPELSRILRRALAKDPDRRYETALGLRNDLQALAENPDSTGNRRLPHFVIPASLVAALLVAFLVFKPFTFEIGSDQPADASERPLAVLYFENMVDQEDPERLGEIVTNLIITALSESKFVKVVSSQRLYAILKRRGEEGLKDIDRQIAGEVAVQAGAGTMLLGSILQTSPTYVITSLLVDTETGEILESQRIDGNPGEEIFALVDRLSGEVKSDLALPDAAAGESDVSVKRFTTHSVEAYRLYLQAIEKSNNWDQQGARDALESAIAIDSTFAMAYYGLASPTLLSRGVTTIEEQREAAMKAVSLADQVTRRERRYILARAAMLEGNHDQAIEELEALLEEYPEEVGAISNLAMLYRDYKQDRQAQIRWLNRRLEIDPTDHDNYNGLAYAYWEVGDSEQAIWAINQAIRLAPDDPNSYDTRGEFYAWMGNLEKALESYEIANEMAPKFGRVQMAYIHQEMGNVERARELYQLIGGEAKSAAGRVVESLRLVNTMTRSGQLGESIEALNQAMDASELEGYIGLWYWYLLNKRAKMHHYRKEFDLAETDARRSLDWARKAESIDSILFWADLIIMLSQRGEFDMAEGELAELKEHTHRLYPRDLYLYWWARGWLEMERGDTDAACSSLEESVRLEGKEVKLHYSLGLAYLKAGRVEDAVHKLELTTRGAHYSERGRPVWSGLSYYHLGRAYEEAGRLRDAADEYDAFLTLFKDADPVFDEVGDARARLERLRPGS